MTEELSKIQLCIVMRGGIELWVDKEKADKLADVLGSINEHKFITITGDFGEKVINTADISGILSAEDIEDAKRRKNGQWKCQWGHWHDKYEKCNHQNDRQYGAVFSMNKEPVDQKRVDRSLSKLRQQREKLLGKRSMK